MVFSILGRYSGNLMSNGAINLALILNKQISRVSRGRILQIALMWMLVWRARQKNK
jgi:hypothetical protein